MTCHFDDAVREYVPRQNGGTSVICEKQVTNNVTKLINYVSAGIQYIMYIDVCIYIDRQIDGGGKSEKV